MPKKEHELEPVSVTRETHVRIREYAQKNNLFEYEVVEAAIESFLSGD